MNGQPRCCASSRPSVDLPAPRRPTSAMRRARSAFSAARHARLDLLGERRQLAFRHLREQIENVAERDRARARFREQRGGGKIERLRDRAQHAHGRVAGAAFDLRQVPLRGFRRLRQLPPRHAALGAIAPHLAADRGEEGRNRRRRRFAGREQSPRPAWLLSARPPRDLMHYSSCLIVHTGSRLASLPHIECRRCYSKIFRQPPACGSGGGSLSSTASGPGSSGAWTSGITGSASGCAALGAAARGRLGSRRRWRRWRR